MSGKECLISALPLLGKTRSVVVDRLPLSPWTEQSEIEATTGGRGMAWCAHGFSPMPWPLLFIVHPGPDS